jgi:hypothetical protein
VCCIRADYRTSRILIESVWLLRPSKRKGSHRMPKPFAGRAVSSTMKHGGVGGVEKQGEVRKTTGPLAGASCVGLRHAGLQAQVLDFRMASCCVAAPLVTEAWVGVCVGNKARTLCPDSKQGRATGRLMRCPSRTCVANDWSGLRALVNTSSRDR